MVYSILTYAVYSCVPHQDYFQPSVSFRSIFPKFPIPNGISKISNNYFTKETPNGATTTIYTELIERWKSEFRDKFSNDSWSDNKDKYRSRKWYLESASNLESESFTCKCGRCGGLNRLKISMLPSTGNNESFKLEKG